MRISKKDKAEYNRLKKNVQSKINRVKKKDNLDLSGLMELPPLESFTRKDFNIWKEDAKKFSSRVNKVKHNEHGVPYTNQLVKEYQKRAEHANKISDKFNKKFKDLPYLSGGKDTNITVEMKNMIMKDPDTVGNRTKQKFDINEIKDIRGLERNMKRIDRYQSLEDYHTQLEEMRNNWVVGVMVTLGSDGDALIEKVMAMSPELFYEMYQSIDEMSFEYFYNDDNNTPDTSEIAKALEQSINKQMKTNHGNLLKGFPSKI
jgi:hypothetical protein